MSRREQRTVYLGASQIEALTKLSADTGASQAAIIRDAIDHYLSLVEKRRAEGRPPRMLLVDNDERSAAWWLSAWRARAGWLWPDHPLAESPPALKKVFTTAARAASRYDRAHRHVAAAKARLKAKGSQR